MSVQTEERVGLFRHLRNWLGAKFVAEVPADVAVCEFNCGKTTCPQIEWAACEKRQHVVVSG